MDTKTLDGYGVKNGRNKPLDARDDDDIMRLYHLLKEHRKPLPRRHYNRSNWMDGNALVRFDGLPLHADVRYLIQLIPPALSKYVSVYDNCPYFLSIDSNCKYGFVKFTCHNMAKHFLGSFNGKSYRGITYKLSWAQYSGYKVEEDDDDDFTKWYVPHTDSDTETFSDSDTDSDSDSDSDYDTSSALAKYYAEDVKTPFKELYSYLDKEFHGHEDKWRFVSCEYTNVHFYYELSPSKTSSIIFLFEVDPVVNKSHMERIFEKYGQCAVHLPDGKCYGYVEFTGKECAEDAFKALFYLMPKLKVCYLKWGCRTSKDQEKYWRYMVIECPVFGENCPHSHEKAQAQSVLDDDDDISLRDEEFISARLGTEQKTEDVKGKNVRGWVSLRWKCVWTAVILGVCLDRKLSLLRKAGIRR